MGDSVAKRAVREAKEVSRLAVDAARAEIIEQLTPAIKQIIDGRLRAGSIGEDVDRLRRAADGHGETEFEEGRDMGKDKEDDKNESVAALFPGIAEADEAPVDEAAEDPDGGGEVAEASMDGDVGVDEEIDLSEQELNAMYEGLLQLEVDVSKGFRDMEPPHDFGAGAKAQYQSDPHNLADMKSGEHPWQDEEPPAVKRDWIPEGKVQMMIRKGLAENKALRSQNAKLTEMVKTMHRRLSEMNLFNSKIKHVNQFLTRNRLTSEQKRSVIESIDRGKSIAEVKNIYASLESAFKVAGAVTESRRPAKGDAQRRRTPASPDAKVLRESVDRSSENSRWKHLAGILNGGND